MQGCIFCKIVVATIPSYNVYEDKDFLGFLDVNPRTRGHALIIPKKHVRWVYEVENFNDYWGAALKLTHAMQKSLSPHFVTYATHGLEVPHAHIHIMPRDAFQTAFIPQPISISKEELDHIATLIRRAS